jgi:serine/threonine-protein kinase RsbT
MSYRRIKVLAERDVLIAASTAATMAQKAGLSFTDCARVETAVSELARNLLVHANGGTLILTLVSGVQRAGLQVCAVDSGPGIVDVSRALQDGFTTQSSLGIGLGVAKRMMDDFSICSHPGWGTSITAVKWNR